MPRKAATPAATPSKSKPVAPQPDAKDAAEVSDAGIRKEIAKAAYQRAERRGFVPGHEVEDWLAAEAQVKSRLGLTGKPN
jgi:hypothetical protein